MSCFVFDVCVSIFAVLCSVDVCMRACVRACVHARVRSCVRAFVRVCVCACACVCVSIYTVLLVLYYMYVCVCFDVSGVRECLHFDFCCVFLFGFWRVVLWCIFHVGYLYSPFDFGCFCVYLLQFFRLQWLGKPVLIVIGVVRRSAYCSLWK